MNILMIVISVVLIVIMAITMYKQHIKNKTKLSFREASDLTGLPVVTFNQGDKKFNFLLDTGSSLSVINSKILNKISHHKIDGMEGQVMGMSGEYQTTQFTQIHLNLKDIKFEESFQVVDMSEAFGSIKQETGVTVHGILGSSFFQKYKYVIDFKELVAYCKR